MKIPADIRMHLKLGVPLAVGIAADIALALHVSPPLAIAVAGMGLGWGVERYQAIRREGVASYTDMLASAAASLVVAVAWGVGLGWTAV